MNNYSTEIKQYFYHLDHAGELAPSAQVYSLEQGTLEQGDVVRFSLEIVDNIIKQARFKAYGSVALIAGAEYICRWLEEKTVDEAKKIDAKQILRALALSQLKIHVAVLITQCIKKLLQERA